jgi:outer membrane lipoprotein-sorting protein
MRRQVMMICAVNFALAMLFAAAASAAVGAAPAVAPKVEAPAKSEPKAGSISTDELLAKLAKSEAEVKSLESDMKMSMKMGAQSMSMTGHMATQPVMKDGKRTGMLMNMKQQMSMGDAGEMNTLVVCDGEFLWAETRHPALGVMVTKNKPDPAKMQSGDTEQLRERYTLKYVGDEDFDGQKMWVLEGVLKATAAAAAAPGQQGDPEKIRAFIGQKDSIVHRIIAFDKAGTEMMDMQMSNVKVNAKVDPALFKYTPPADAKVMDMTKDVPAAGDATKVAPKSN